MKYCSKHNLKYMEYLKDCPICIGENNPEIAGFKLPIEIKGIHNKMIDYKIGEEYKIHDGASCSHPIQHTAYR